MITLNEFDTIAFAIYLHLGEGAIRYCPPETEQRVFAMRKDF